MKKSLLLLSFLLAITTISIGYIFYPKPASFTKYCAFCDQSVLEKQTFYSDDLVLALYTHKPAFPGHSLIIPKRHVERFEMLSKEEIAQIGEVIKKVDKAVSKVFHTSSYLLLQKNGIEVGQSVPHVHFHYIPRKQNDNSSVEFVLKMFLANAKGPISQSEMSHTVIKLKQTINETP